MLRLLPLADCIGVVEDSFRAIGERRTLGPVVTGVQAGTGGFHIKAAGLQLQRGYFGAKLNANFPHNPTRAGLPTIQGVIVLCDSEEGRTLGVFDSTAITALRTGAATAVAARLLSRRDARVATIVGCGVQGRVQLHALTLVRPVDCAFAYDLDLTRAEQFAREASAELGIRVTPTQDLQGALAKSQMCVTCTPSNSPLIFPGDIAPGTFIAAVGADSEYKSEIHPGVMADSRVVPDLLEQALRIGDLHHAIGAGLMTAAEIHAELGEVVSGLRPGRTTPDEVFVFDSTGTALQDVAAAALVYQRALATGTARTIDLAA